MLLLLFIQLIVIYLYSTKNIEIMNLDDYITGTHDPLNPANWKDSEQLTELEEQQDWNMELCAKIHIMQNHLKKLKEIEESFKTFGFLSYEEQTEKNNILNKY